MQLGNKIKALRLERGLTQQQLASDVITRNMISSIENGKADPSLNTLRYLSDALSVPLPLLLCDEIDPHLIEKHAKIERIKSLYSTKRYKECVEAIKSIEVLDDELSYILASAAVLTGKNELFSGALKSATEHLKLAIEQAELCLYDTSAIECSAYLYLSVCNNVYSPLLELDTARFERLHLAAVDLEFYKYLTMDATYKFSNIGYANHIRAKQLIKDRLYKDALSLLNEITSDKDAYLYNSYFTFCLYSDLELCYKQLYDFENAYRYSAKRISLIESFES